jgi:N-acetylneuraminate synthase
MSGLNLKSVNTGWAKFSCLVVGEVGQAHDGSLGAAHAYIDAIAGTGASLKFQTHIAQAESSTLEPFGSVRSPDATVQAIGAINSPEQWAAWQHARESGLVFLSSPFSEEADMLSRSACPLEGISGEVNNPLLLTASWQPAVPSVINRDEPAGGSGSYR